MQCNDMQIRLHLSPNHTLILIRAGEPTGHATVSFLTSLDLDSSDCLPHFQELHVSFALTVQLHSPVAKGYSAPPRGHWQTLSDPSYPARRPPLVLANLPLASRPSNGP